MKNNTSSRSGLFLMELIIAILFFSLAGAICVRLFVSSHLISKSSVELNYSLEWCQNVAEVFYGTNGNFEEMTQLFDNCWIEEDSSTFYLLFDKEFSPLPFTQSASSLKDIDYSYIITVSITEGELYQCDIVAPIYELSVVLYPQKETSNEK